MFKMRFALLGVLALFVVSGIGASTASATGGPFWHVNGSKLAQERKQLKLQSKGSAVLSGKLIGLNVTVTCKNSISEGASIEGSGVQKPGQDKGRLYFSTCEMKVEGSTACKVVEPIVTNQTKSRLVTYKNATGQSKYADLFEPQQGPTATFVTLKVEGATCPAVGEFPVTGTQVAEVQPKEQETQEGLLNFPATPITTVFWFGNEQITQPEEVKTGLLFGGVEAKFLAAYGARLDAGGTYGVFDK